MNYIIWYNTEVGKYDFGTKEDFALVCGEFDLIYAEESNHLPLEAVSRLTQKLNKNLKITRLDLAA